MPHWKPQEYGEITKRTNHRAWCVLCGTELYKGDKVVRTQKHGIRMLCSLCANGLKAAQGILKKFYDRTR
jgi:hypothetical protein